MNRNKIIFWVIWVVILIIFIVLFFIISSTWNKEKKSSKTKDFSIWVLQDDKNNFWDFLEDFKSKSKNYKNTNFGVISFDNYDEYYNALVWAFLRWEAPDMFVLNNNDWNIFDWQILWIDPALVSVDDFRKNYDSVFSNDLIRKIKVDDKETEFLVWIPLGYENLWIFYNFRELKWKKLTTWAYVNEIIKELRDNESKIWIALWNWTTVRYAEDIITQFFLLDSMKTLTEVVWNNMKSSISNYIRFWDIEQDNKYDELFEKLNDWNKNNIDAFSAWDVQMVIWYPRLLEEIDKKWFNKSFLRAEVFPTYNENKWNLLINYNYFAINKNSPNTQAATDLIVYMASPEWQQKYLDTFKYYMPSQLGLLEKRLEENILNWYSLKYKNFYNQNLELTTFNKWVRTIYDNDIKNVLDNWANSIELFEILRKKVLCISNKIISSDNLEANCK